VKKWATLPQTGSSRLVARQSYHRANRVIREGVRKLEEIRKAVGDDFDIAMDAHGRLTTTMAIDFCTRVRISIFVRRGGNPTGRPGRARTAALEDEDASGHRRASFTKWASRTFARATLWTTFKPTFATGGIMELKKSAFLCETYRLNLAPTTRKARSARCLPARGCHHPRSHDSGVETSARRHGSVGWIEDMFKAKGRVKNGLLTCYKAGLGMTLNER